MRARLRFVFLLMFPLLGVRYAHAEVVTQPETPAASRHHITGNVELTSDYRFRGFTQSASLPAIQGGADYSHDWGFYLGNWNSSIAWIGDGTPTAAAPIEMDLYAGYRRSIPVSLGITFDLGAIFYFYPGSGLPSPSPNTLEAYAAFGFGPLSLKYWHAFTNWFGVSDSRHSGYIDFAVNYDTKWHGLLLLGHVGYQWIRHHGDAAFIDWKAGIGEDFGDGFSISLIYVDTHAMKKSVYTVNDKYLGKPTGVLTLVKTF